MMFARRLREKVMGGEITCSVRVWTRAHVKVGGRYPLGPGVVEVTAVREIAEDEITDELARRSGFRDVADLMAVARHGAGETIYLIDFVYRPDFSAVGLI